MPAMTEKLFAPFLSGKSFKSDWFKLGFLLFFVTVNTILQYEARQSAHHIHLFFQELYLVPLVLASFWFGLYGAVLASLLISAIYIPFIAEH